MFIIGHRGAKAREPENTLRSFREGMRCADYVEVDARLSRDRIAIVIHDGTVDRTTNGRGPVSSFSLGELRELDAGKREMIPTLEEVCREVRDTCGLFCELKEPGSEEVIGDVLSREAPGDLWIGSFHEACITTAKQLVPRVKTGLIISRMADSIPGRAVNLDADAILLKYDLLSPDLILACQDQNLLVLSWTLNTHAEFEQADRLGIYGMASDDPCAARQFFG